MGASSDVSVSCATEVWITGDEVFGSVCAAEDRDLFILMMCSEVLVNCATATCTVGCPSIGKVQQSVIQGYFSKIGD